MAISSSPMGSRVAAFDFKYRRMNSGDGRNVSRSGESDVSSARGVARSEGPLIVRSLARLHGPIAHGWYVAMAGKHARLRAFRRSLGAGYEVRRFGQWVVVRTTEAPLTRLSWPTGTS